MAIKINEKILSIPPYISTNWSRILSLHMKESQLVVTLHDGDLITIPELPKETIESIFNFHAAYLEKTNTDAVLSQKFPMEKDEQLNHLIEQQGNALFRFGVGSMDELGNALQHNPSQSNGPNLPPELLQKIATISKILASEEVMLPKAEPLCNCFHCQIARALNPNAIASPDIANEEEIVLEHELQFQQWCIAQTDEKLFSVTSRLDDKEKYNVYLGQPIGCTCGKQGCEHIVAVLKS